MLALQSLATRHVAKRACVRTAKAPRCGPRIGARHLNKRNIVPEYSPDVFIYKFPFPAIISISNRVTGVGLAVGFWAAGTASLFCPGAIPALWACIKTYPFLLAITKGIVAAPLSFHYLAGVRHLVWDNSNIGIESVEAVEKSSKILLGATAVVTAGAMML